MEGLSEALLNNHFALYQGYVTNTNKLLDILPSCSRMIRGNPEFAELKRRLGWEFNGMRLHEFYFENLGGKGTIDKADGSARSSQKTSAATRPGKRPSGSGRHEGCRLGGSLSGRDEREADQLLDQ